MTQINKNPHFINDLPGGRLPRLKRGRYFDPRSLSAQMMISSVLLVILTAVITSVPALWIIRKQFDNQAWAQIEQGYNAAQALYKATEQRLASFATLTAQSPALAELIKSQDIAALEAYLRTIQETEKFDLLAICTSAAEPVVSTASRPPSGLCTGLETGSAYLVSGQTLPQAWLVASEPIEGLPGTGPKIVVGLHLNTQFAGQMHQQTGLDHSIMTNDQIVATSLEALPPVKATPAPQASFLTRSDIVVCCEYAISSQPFYAARLQLEGTALQAEVALPVTDIQTTQNVLRTIFLVSVLIVAGIGSVLGVIFARHISRPLVSLSDAAARFSQGDLHTPVQVDTQVREVGQVSQALEQARLDLSHTLTDLKKEKDWGEHLFESIVEGIVTLDNDCRITFFSRGAERITGWMREDVLHRPCSEVFRLPGNDTPFNQHIPLPGQKNEIVIEAANKRQITLSITRAQLTPSKPENSEIALVFRDVSEEYAIHHLLGYFIANIAHEFRTPLSALAASIELLIDQAPDLNAAEVDELLKSLHLGVLSLQTLVDNLLESASIETGHFRVSPRPYDLDKIIEEAVRIMEPLLDKYEQKLTLEVPPKLPLVQADPRRVVQVLVNLISNASKYGPGEANIHLSAVLQGQWIKIQVADRGPGISSQYRELLFQRFEYPASDRDQRKVGAGLGLSVVKAIVEAHAGQVDMEDRSGGGSIFWFTLPVAEET
jgi:PAS domain S-box-containing protein